MKAPAVVAVLGAGRMGRGIALAFAYAGHPVRLLDVKERPEAEAAVLERDALAEIEGDLRILSELGLFEPVAVPDIVGRIRYADRGGAPEALAQSSVLFEAVPEVMAAKEEAFAFACRHLPPDALVASTSSTFLSTTLAAFVPRPERFLNAHWLNPAYLLPLVELSPHPATAPAATGRMRELLDGIGKVPVVCAPQPGYIVPRLQSVLMNEAARMIEQGVATPEEIDRATRYGLGIRYAGMGLVEFIDFGGNDILYYASRYLAGALGDARYDCPEAVTRNVAEGRLGLKTGIGFYDWRGVDVPGYRKAALSKLLDLLRMQGLTRAPGPAPT